MTANQHRILRRLARGPITHKELRTLDQRSLAPMFWRGWFRLDANLASHITDAGYEALMSYQGAPAHRKNSRRPIFRYRIGKAAS